jgi:hypothetical protein
MSAAPKKTLTAAERQAKLQEMLAKQEREAAERKQKLTEQIAAQAAKAEAEAVAAAAKAARNASLAVFGVPAMKEKSVTRMSAAKRLELMMAQNEGRATNVVDPAAVKKAAEEAFKALSAPKKIEYLRAKAAADIAEAEAKLAVYRVKVEERLARDIAAVHKEAGDPAEALSDLVSAVASSSSSSMAVSPASVKSVRRTTQQVFNNLQRELAYEEGRVQRRAEGKALSPRPTATRKSTPERVKTLQAKLAESQMKLNSAATRKLESASKKSATKQKANNNAARLEAYMRARAEKKKAESSGAAASSRSNE